MIIYRKRFRDMMSLVKFEGRIGCFVFLVDGLNIKGREQGENENWVIQNGCC